MTIHTYRCVDGHETEVEALVIEQPPTVECHECGREARLVVVRGEPSLAHQLVDLMEKWEMEANENAVKESLQREALVAGQTVICTSENTPQVYGAEHYISDLKKVLSRKYAI